MTVIDQIIDYHLQFSDLKKLENVADFCNQEARANLLELLLAKHVSKGHLMKSLRISKKLGRTLTIEEKDKLFTKEVDISGDFDTAIDQVPEPEKSDLSLRLVQNYIDKGWPTLAADHVNYLAESTRAHWLEKCLTEAKTLDEIHFISKRLNRKVDLEKTLMLGLNMGGRHGYYLARDCYKSIGRKMTENEFEIYLNSSITKKQEISDDTVYFVDDYLEEKYKTKWLENILAFHLKILSERKFAVGYKHRRQSAKDGFYVAFKIAEKLKRDLSRAELKIILRWVLNCGSLYHADELSKLLDKPLKDEDLEIILVNQLKSPYDEWGSEEYFKTRSITETINRFSTAKQSIYHNLLFDDNK